MVFKNKKYYKDLYNTELQNNALLIEQNSRLSKERIAANQETAKLKVELEDTKGFLAQETEAKEVLKKERTKLRKMITQLGGDWKNEK